MIKIFLSLMTAFCFAVTEPLSVADAFGLSAKVDEHNVEFNFNLAQNIHVYKDAVNVTSGGKSLIEFINMPSFSSDGEREVFTQAFSIFVPIKLLTEINGKGDFRINLQYQGCAKDGICYQPQSQDYIVKKSIDTYVVTQIPKDGQNLEPQPISEQDGIALNLAENGFWISVATFLGYGVLLSLTPCVFPMIPILSSIIVAKSSEKISVKKGFFLSFVYVTGMSTAYAIAGILAGVFGSGLQTALQTPTVLLSFSAVFVALALSMFGLYELQLPVKAQNFISRKSQSKSGLIGIFIMGFLSALITGPCVAAPLAGALLYIANSGNVILGGATLFAMGLGAGLPLLIIGASSGKILPRPGVWMENIKKFFGFVMIFTAVWLSGKVLGEQISMLLYGIVGIFACVFFGAFDTTNEHSTAFKRISKSVFLIAFIYSILLIVGSFSGAKSILEPLEGFKVSKNAAKKSELNFIEVSNLAELENTIKNSSKPVLIDFYATWCASCNELDEITFKDEAVLKKLENFTLLRVDVTKNSSDDARIMKKFGLIGPPAILFFRADGDIQKELKNARLIGFYPPGKFLEHLKKFGL